METGIRSICRQDVVTTSAREELTSAAHSMRDKHIGYLVVTEFDIGAQKERPVGVLTDRDIVVAVVARETDPRSLRVEDVMTRNPVVVADDATIGRALQQMRWIGVRRIPVVDERGTWLACCRSTTSLRTWRTGSVISPARSSTRSLSSAPCGPEQDAAETHRPRQWPLAVPAAARATAP